MEKKLLLYKENQVPGNIYFKYVGYITEDGAMRLQEKAGYHPAGYGFYSYVFVSGIARWVCSNTCD